MKRLVVYALLGGFAAVLVVLSGVIPLKASSGHWAITFWLLDFTKRRSVATHSIGIEVPPLGDPALILRGAGHYEAGCRPCHGAPDGLPPRIPASMLPPPPDLKRQVARWSPAEQFTIVRHGIKFTGMPAWPAPTRDDEVWAVVAFLQRLPSLDGAGYDRLVQGTAPSAAPNAAAAEPSATAPSATAGEISTAVAGDPVTDLVRARCDRCHGAGGRGREHAASPRLAGQKPAYLRLALTAYADGRRHSGTMAPIAAALDAPTIAAVAEHYAAVPAASAGSVTAGLPAPRPDSDAAPASTGPSERGGPADAAAIRGGAIARLGIPAQGVPRCVECHGPAATKRHAAYPRLAGQFAPYLEQQLRLLAEGRRGGSPFVHLMHEVAPRLTPDQRRDVAAWFASLPPGDPIEP